MFIIGNKKKKVKYLTLKEERNALIIRSAIVTMDRIILGSKNGIIGVNEILKDEEDFLFFINYI